MICPRCRRNVDELAHSHAADAVVCLDCHLAAAPPLPPPTKYDVALGLLERHERREEAKRMHVLERAPPGLIEAAARVATSGGLRPVVDADLELIRVDCVYCRAQDQDPSGMYRPVRVAIRARTRGTKPAAPLLTIHCDACGFHDEHPI